MLYRIFRDFFVVYTTIISLSIVLYGINEATRNFSYYYSVPDDYILIGNKGYKLNKNDNIIEINAKINEKIVSPGIIERLFKI